MSRLFQIIGISVVVIVVLCVALAVLGSALGTNTPTTTGVMTSVPVTAVRSEENASTEEDPTAAPEATPIPEPTPEPTPETAKVGDDVRVADVRWKITTAEDLGQTLKSDNPYTKDKTTPGRFVRIQFEIENLGKDMKTFAGIDLIDSQGRTLKRSSDVFGFIPTEQACVFENLNPNVPKACMVIYEVPADAFGLKADAGDLSMFGGEHMLIDLGF